MVHGSQALCNKDFGDYMTFPVGFHGVDVCGSKQCVITMKSGTRSCSLGDELQKLLTFNILFMTKDLHNLKHSHLC